VAYQGMPAAFVRASLGLGVSLQQSEQERRREELRLAEQRRITEAEIAQKEASGQVSAFQEKVVSWLPKVGIAVGLVVAGVLLYKRTRRKNPRRRSAPGRARRR